MALALRQRNELDAAAHHLTQGLELCRLFGNPRSGYLALARLRQAQGDWDGAFRAVQGAERQGSGSGATFDPLDVEHCRFWLHLVRGNSSTGLASASRSVTERTGQDVTAASGWVQECGLSADDELCFGGEPGHILLARALIALNRPAEATRLLERFYLVAKAGGREERAIEILALRAMACQAQGEAAGG